MNFPSKSQYHVIRMSDNIDCNSVSCSWRYGNCLYIYIYIYIKYICMKRPKLKSQPLRHFGHTLFLLLFQCLSTWSTWSQLFPWLKFGKNRLISQKNGGGIINFLMFTGRTPFTCKEGKDLCWFWIIVPTKSPAGCCKEATMSPEGSCRKRFIAGTCERKGGTVLQYI